MSALSGQVITTIPDKTGAAAVCVTWFFNPAGLALWNNPSAWTDPTGTTWPAGTGALIAVNLLGRTVRVRVNDAQGNLVRRVQLPAGSRSLTAAQLAAAPAPDGPYTSATDFNGLTFDLA
jgi:hypothetical protein